MTQPVILKKLSEALGQSIGSESHVVYVLVEIRKFIELEELREYEALYFYCSWAVHTRMTKKSAQKLLRLFDDAHPLLKQGSELHELPMAKEIERAISMREFHKQLRTFLETNGLPTSIVGQEWTKFLRLYASVIEDCPLKAKADDNNLKNVSHIVLSLETAPKKIEHERGDYLLYKINWTCYSKDGRSGTLFSLFTIP